MLEPVLRDLRFVGRALLRQRAFTTVAVLTFAVGIGVNVAAFSVLDRVLFRPLPYGAAQELVLVRQCAAGRDCSGTVPAGLAYESQGLRSFDGVAVVGPSGSYPVAREPGEDPPVRLITASPGLLRVLRVSPRHGRDFSADDAEAGRRVAILSYESWQARFGGSLEVIGRELPGPGAAPIVGVLPPGFIPPMWNGHDPEWDGLLIGSGPWVDIAPTVRSFPVIARLSAGITIDQARSEVAALAAALPAETRGGEPAPLIRVDSLQRALFSNVQSNFWLILGTTALLLVLACANLSTLLLAYGRTRERETAIAAALGASRTRLLAQALLASVVICAAGSIAALAAVAASSRVLTALLPPLIARYATGAEDPRVLMAALAAALLCALVAGIIPALRGARIDLRRVLQQAPQSAGHARLRGGAGLLAIETAIGALLVLGALLMLRSFQHLSDDDLGFRADGLYALRIVQQPTSPEASLATFEQALDALRDVPGATAIAGADSPMVTGEAAMRGFEAGSGARGGRYEVSAGVFDALGTPLLAGRAFSEAEVRQRAPVAILSAEAARALWPGTSHAQLIGQELRLGDDPPRRIVGVVPDVKRGYGQESVPPALYLPLGTEPAIYGAAVLRTRGDVPLDLAAVRQRVTDRIGPATITVTPVAASFAPALRDPQFRAVLVMTLALAALLLAATGLYAVAAFDARRRQYEIGVRLSFGATAGDIRRTVILGACRPVFIGIAAGFVAAFWAVTVLQQFLYQVDPRDPWTYALVAGVLVTTGIAAAWIPAWRAGRVDPSAVLRAQ